MTLPHVSVNKRVFVPLALLFVVLTLIFPRQAKFSYDYRKGSPWSHETLVAQFDFPILKTEEQMREARGRSKAAAIPCYRFRQEVMDEGKKAVSSADLRSASYLKPCIISAMDAIWSCGVVPEEGVKVADKTADASAALLYVHKDKKVVKKPVSEVFRESEARTKLFSEVSAKARNINVDSVLTDSGIYSLLVPNLEYDSHATETMNASESGVSPTQGFVGAGEVIVKQGEVVTAELAQVLDSYKIEYEDNLGYSGSQFLFWLGNALLALVMVVLFVLVIHFLNRYIFKSTNKFLYLIFVFLLTTIMALLVGKHAPKFLYMAPFTLTALYLESFFRNKLILPVCCIAFLPLLIFSNNGVVLFVMFIVASQVAVLSFKYFNQGWQQFITAGIVFLSLVLTYCAFRMTDMVEDNPYETIIYLFVGSVLTVAGYTLIFLFEKMFNLVSNNRLNQLCDTNNPLLRELESKAPGTFQHSLQVMNMVDAAARSIDANAPLLRAAALYHDIGKMKNPLCFIENEGLGKKEPRYHEGLTLKESSEAILKHVDDGLEIAREHRLPELVTDFIRTHHGTSVTAYFYNKHINEGGSPDDIAYFSYKGPKPHTTEQVLLMICDTIEAASRTLKDNSPETFSKFVEGVVDSKLQAGQLDESAISIKDLKTVKEVLKSYLLQIHHERIVYPGQKISNKS